jgi:hypothetical protein
VFIMEYERQLRLGPAPQGEGTQRMSGKVGSIERA